MTDEELIKRLRAYARIEHAAAPWGFAGEGEVLSIAADRIEALVKERDDALEELSACTGGTGGCGYWREAAKRQETRAERLKAALHNCVGMLDQLVAESGRDIEWGAEDPFRMGEWFEPENLAQIEQARAALKGADHE